ncbi:helix-turn-helix domain-containing protein [Pseudolysinimonas yzui]|uniref:HTH cro/C1-type domain-containing protein n=1 Tax=Pseudolysinimonas yzui TaxID=2708254 RepID=A0A8J3GS58_9MICO|nr:helix-turn-helix transcriptional regulator [Pseudolysinimonas yzui]GHF22494.1 hypothetical protein GCM10011600_24500 [Pseudolysinimonas yzui]
MGLLAARLKALREDRGLTYEELAEATGLSRRGVISLERGERSGNVRSWFRVARALGISMADLMSSLDSDPPPRSLRKNIPES